MEDISSGFFFFFFRGLSHKRDARQYDTVVAREINSKIKKEYKTLVRTTAATGNRGVGDWRFRASDIPTFFPFFFSSLSVFCDYDFGLGNKPQVYTTRV